MLDTQCNTEFEAIHKEDLLSAVQVSDDANVMLNGFGTVVNSLKMRAKPYLPQICGTIKWRLNNKSAKIRQQAADLIARIAVVMKVRSHARQLQHSSGHQQHIAPLLRSIAIDAISSTSAYHKAVLLRPVRTRRPAMSKSSVAQAVSFLVLHLQHWPQAG